MSDSKLSDLTAAASVAPADLAYVVQGGTSKKATREILQTYDAGTLTTDKKVLDLSATWNAAGVTFTGVKFNVTDTASNAASLLMDLQVCGVSKLTVAKDGAITASGRVNATQGLLVAGTFGGQGTWASINAIYSNGFLHASTYVNATTYYYFGGTTSSFPALKRSSTTLQVRLADDSADAPFSSGRATIDGLTVGKGGATSVADNTAVGFEALNSASLTGDGNSGFGYRALQSNTSGRLNTAVGEDALRTNTTGVDNVGIGQAALTTNNSGSSNTACGRQALALNSTGSSNSAVGTNALLYFNTSNNVAIGSGALVGGSTTVANNTGVGNIGIGYQAGDAITSGSTNIAIGYQVDVDSATGSSQINIGDRYFHDRIRLLERTSDPAKPTEGNMIVWMSDGTGLGDDGDVIIASTAGGVTNYAILFDHSAGTVWP